MGRRRAETRRERLARAREEWTRYGPAILDLMDRLEALEKASKSKEGEGRHVRVTATSREWLPYWR